jgi:hypothetical protein
LVADPFIWAFPTEEFLVISLLLLYLAISLVIGFACQSALRFGDRESKAYKPPPGGPRHWTETLDETHHRANRKELGGSKSQAWGHLIGWIIMGWLAYSLGGSEWWGAIAFAVVGGVLFAYALYNFVKPTIP